MKIKITTPTEKEPKSIPFNRATPDGIYIDDRGDYIIIGDGTATVVNRAETMILDEWPQGLLTPAPAGTKIEFVA
jgi:hypothetical protein